MYDPETTFQPIIDEITESIDKMRKLKQIDDKMKYSEHIHNLSSTFDKFMSTVSMMMDNEMMEDLDDLDDMDDEFYE
ncbi:hypothetical protein OAF42_03100 [Planctomicrobium sp.]|nr:hypothetical protein [Planctomicrobium sp.]MDA7503495.1 hypothetical protein [bacterium]MDB4733411.1 hypothetical protein [Planctomicrobium sp.]